MDIKRIIQKKSNGEKLNKEEIDFFIEEYTNGSIEDYQASALLMAIKIVGMDEEECFYMTTAMLNSGEIIDTSSLGITVDKHSTGGVSDTTSIALVPICACVGVNMLKLSGRGLGFTGGTIDKLEAFDNLKVDIDIESAKQIVSKIGGCIISASKNLAPADKKIYALRDTTATVDSIPLIASSIMSKKLASGADVIVLDVKYGDGAFMKDKKSAIKLAELMVKIGKNAGKKMDYVIDDMNEPLGYYVGNRLEAYEAIELLSGKLGKLRDVTLELSAKCVSLGLNIEYNDALNLVTDAVDSGLALEKMKEMIAIQGGSLELFDGLKMTPTLVVKSNKSGILYKIKCEQLGHLVGTMGATRQKLIDEIDYKVGIKTFHKLNEKINKGDILFEIYAKNMEQAKMFAPQFENCYELK